MGFTLFPENNVMMYHTSLEILVLLWLAKDNAQMLHWGSLTLIFIGMLKTTEASNWNIISGPFLVLSISILCNKYL